MKKIKWGIVGAGKIASRFASDLRHAKYGELCAVASRDVNKSKFFGEKFGASYCHGSYKELYDNPEIEAVYIATPHNFHFENSRDALQAGKAVLCEKPLTVNTEECRQLIAIAKASDQYLMEGMWTYFLPPVQKAMEWINDGKIGSITHIKADFGFKASYDPEGRLFNPDLAGGSVLDIGIYPIALSWLVMREDPKNITVVGRKAPTGVDSKATFIFDYDEVTASLVCSLNSHHPNHAYVIGTEGYIEIPNFWMSSEAKLYRENELMEHYSAERSTFGFNYEIDAVSEDLIAGRKESNIVPHSTSLKLQEHMSEVLKKI